MWWMNGRCRFLGRNVHWIRSFKGRPLFVEQKEVRLFWKTNQYLWDVSDELIEIWMFPHATGWETWTLFGRPSTSVIEWLLGTLSCWQPWSWRDYKESPISSPRSAVLSDHCELNLLWDSACTVQSCAVAHENNRQLSSALWPVNSLWVNFCQL